MDKALALLTSLPVAAATFNFVLGATFSNTINLGALLVAFLVVVLAGFFTIRANVAKIWRENYEGEKARAEALESRNKDLVAALAAAAAELEAEKRKTDVTALVAEIKALRKEADDRAGTMLAAVTRFLNDQFGLIRDGQANILRRLP